MMLTEACITVRWRLVIYTEGGRIRVLLVDDNPHFLKVASQWIAGQPGLQLVSTAENGKEALEKLQKIPIDLLLIDAAMPVLNGLQATVRAKALPNPPKVIMTSMYDIETEALAAGADGFANKPNFVDVIPRLVESIFYGHCRTGIAEELTTDEKVLTTVPQSKMAEG